MPLGYKTEQCATDVKWRCTSAVGTSLPWTFFSYPNATIQSLSCTAPSASAWLSSSPCFGSPDTFFLSFGTSSPYDSDYSPPTTDDWLASIGASISDYQDMNEALATTEYDFEEAAPPISIRRPRSHCIAYHATFHVVLVPFSNFFLPLSRLSSSSGLRRRPHHRNSDNPDFPDGAARCSSTLSGLVESPTAVVSPVIISSTSPLRSTATTRTYPSFRHIQARPSRDPGDSRLYSSAKSYCQGLCRWLESCEDFCRL